MSDLWSPGSPQSPFPPVEPAPAAPKSGSVFWKVVLGLFVLALICIGMLVLGGKALVAMSGPSGTSTAIAQSTPPRTDTPRLAQVTDQDGHSVIAWRVLDPAPPARLYSAQEGKKVVAVEVTVENQSNDKELFVNPLRFQIVDTDGTIYDGSLGTAAGEITSAYLTRGNSLTGMAAFVLPTNARAASLRFWLREQRLFDGPFISVDLTP